MSILSIELTPELDARLEALAASRSADKAQVVREMIEASLTAEPMSQAPRTPIVPRPGSALELAGDLVGCIDGSAAQRDARAPGSATLARGRVGLRPDEAPVWYSRRAGRPVDQPEVSGRSRRGMIVPTILDTGPLVAFLDRRDPAHAWAVARFREIWPPSLTCEPVIVEACFLLRKTPAIALSVLDLMTSGDLALGFRLQEEAAHVSSLMSRYANVPMSLADACLVRMAELHADAQVLTLDGDFRVYRRNGREAIDAVMPGSVR